MTIEEEYERHPYEPECICKLCDWRRETTAIGPRPAIPESVIPLPTFREASDALKAASKTARVFHQSTERLDVGRKMQDDSFRYRASTYVRPRKPGEIKGKAVRKAAKRERVRALKAAQAVDEK